MYRNADEKQPTNACIERYNFMRVMERQPLSLSVKYDPLHIPGQKGPR